MWSVRSTRARRGASGTYPCQVLRIAQPLLDEIVAHARRDHPDEACGMVLGPEGSDRPERFKPMINAAGSTKFYE